MHDHVRSVIVMPDTRPTTTTHLALREWAPGVAGIRLRADRVDDATRLVHLTPLPDADQHAIAPRMMLELLCGRQVPAGDAASVPEGEGPCCALCLTAAPTPFWP